MEHNIQSLDDMLIDCNIDFKGNSDKHFPLIEFSYNNSLIHPDPLLLMRLCMVGGVDLLLGDLELFSHNFFVPILFIRLWKRFISYGTSCNQSIVGKSLMPTIGEGK